MRTPTAEQQAVVDSTARVRIVRAAPGSGKTWLVAEILRKELSNWPRDGSGIVALSFTRVGGDEIRKGLGHSLGHPHFVGTIDAFLFRYIIRPFLQQVYPNYAAPRLIPADWQPEKWRKRPEGGKWAVRGQGGRSAKNYNLFELCFIGEDQNGPILAHPERYRRSVVPVSPQDRPDLLAAKQRVWRDMGWLSHADTAFLASKMLSNPDHGLVIKDILLRRFPFLIVDELQDTGYYLGKCIHSLVERSISRSVLVGDPDQAIYEFSGARPDLFNRFNDIDGSESLPLSQSRRCTAAVLACATHLKDSTGDLASSRSEDSTVYLVRYQNMDSDIRQVVRRLAESNASREVRVVARQRKVLDKLFGRQTRPVPSLHQPALTHMCNAVRALRQGQQNQAIALALAALDLVVFRYEGVEEGSLAELGLSTANWKRAAVKSLMRAQQISNDLSLYEWQACASVVMREQLEMLGLEVRRIEPQRRKDANTSVSDFLSSEQVECGVNLGVDTIHGVKGQTHDLTVIVCPEQKAAQCISTTWWSQEEHDREERRVAYVAVTRTRGDLVLCIPQDSDERLQERQPRFVATAERYTVDEFINLWTPNLGPD